MCRSPAVCRVSLGARGKEERRREGQGWGESRPEEAALPLLECSGPCRPGDLLQPMRSPPPETPSQRAREGLGVRPDLKAAYESSSL